MPRVLIISPMDRSRIVWSRIKNLSLSKNCLCNIVGFQMNVSEIHNKLSEIILHYLNFALTFLKFTCVTVPSHP